MNTLFIPPFFAAIGFLFAITGIVIRELRLQRKLAFENKMWYTF